MSILSAVAATPIVVLATNTFKHHGLVELLDYPLPVRGFNEIDAICTDIEHVIRSRAELSEHLATRSREILSMIAVGEEKVRDAICRTN